MANGSSGHGRPDLQHKIAAIFRRLMDVEGRGWQIRWSEMAGLTQPSIHRSFAQGFRYRIDEAAGILAKYGIDLVGFLEEQVSHVEQQTAAIPKGLRELLNHPAHGRYVERYPEDREELLEMARRGELDGLEELEVLAKWVEIAERRHARQDSAQFARRSPETGEGGSHTSPPSHESHRPATEARQGEGRVLTIQPPPAPPEPEELVEVPLLGRIAAGHPIEAVEAPLPVLVPRSLAQPASRRTRDRVYALRIAGDSMIDAGIADGDTVIVRPAESAEQGQIVVALVDGREATVKRFYRDGEGPNQRIRLQPANPTQTPILCAPTRVKIQGAVIGVVKTEPEVSSGEGSE